MKSSPLTSGLMHHQIWGQISEEIWDCRTDLSGAVIVMSDILKQTAQPSCCPSLVLPISPGQVFHLTDNEHQTCLFCLRSARVLPVSWQQADLQLPLVTILRSLSPPLPSPRSFRHHRITFLHQNNTPWPNGVFNLEDNFKSDTTLIWRNNLINLLLIKSQFFCFVL